MCERSVVCGKGEGDEWSVVCGRVRVTSDRGGQIQLNFTI